MDRGAEDGGDADPDSARAMKSFWGAIRKALVNLANFFHVLLHMPRQGRYVPRSNTGMAREAMHVTSG